MIRPLVLSRQPCITPGAGQAFGNGVGGSGGGGGGVELGWGLSSGAVVKGCDWASLNRAQPLKTSIAAHSAATPRQADRRIRMIDRLRESVFVAATRRRACCRSRPHAVAQGLSNREIAEAVSLSVRTVESHICRASTKAWGHGHSVLAEMMRSAGS
jgi:hypothetical protein